MHSRARPARGPYRPAFQCMLNWRHLILLPILQRQTTEIPAKQTMSDLNGVFKIVNLSVGALSVVSGATQLLGGVQSFFLGLYLISFGAGIIFLEFRMPPLTYQYASFLFSFLGRGLFYLLIGIITADHSVIKLIFGILISLVGIGYSVLEFIPSIEPPENFRAQGHVLDENDEEDII